MANEKILNTRIALKLDTIENWEKSTLALRKGEVAICVINPTEENGLKEAVTMIKIGEDGVKTFKDLSWNFYAKASDVIDQAKSAESLETFISNVIANSGIASDEAMDALAKRVTDAEGEITILKGDANTAGSVAKAIADAIAALDLANTYDAKGAAAQALVDAKAYVDGKDTAMDERVDVLEAAIAADGVVDTKIKNAIDALDVTDTAVAGKYVSAVNEVDGKVVITRADLPDYSETYAAKVHGHEIADVNGLADAIADAKKAGTDANAALETYKGTNDAAVKKVADDLAAEASAARAAEKANADAIAAMKDHASVDSFADVMAEIAKKQDTIPANTYDAHGAAAQALTDAKDYADGLDEVMDGRVAALEAKFGDGEGNVEAQIAAAVAAEAELREAADEDLQEAIDAINNAETGILKQAKDHADSKDEAIAAAQKAGDDAQDAVDALAAKVGEVPEDKTVVQMIADAQAAATYDDTKVKEDIAANADAIALLNDGSTVEGSVDYKIAQAVAAIMENPDETMNSINELVTWVNDHAQDALELSNKVTANEQDITALEGLVGTEKVADQITNAIAAALKIDGVDKYALASDLTAAIARVAALEAKVDTGDKKVSEYVAAAIEALNIGDYAKAADLTAEINRAKAAEEANATAAAAAKSAADNAQAAADKAQGEVDALELEVAKKANDADLAAVAKSGLIDDLSIGEGTVLVFDCGTSV